METIYATRKTKACAAGVPGAIDAGGAADTPEDATLRIYGIVALAARGAITVEYATALLLQDRADHAGRVLAGWIYQEVE